MEVAQSRDSQYREDFVKRLIGAPWRTVLVAELFCVLFSAVVAQGQANLEFDVASVKPVKDCGGGQRFRNARGSLEVLNMEPTTIIRNAYHLVMEGQLVGFPPWADQACFDLEAKADEDPATELSEARERNLLRLQSLLASRFQLRAHWESRIQHGYVLSAAKAGSKIKPSPPGTLHRTQQGRGTLICAACSVSNLAAFLSNFVRKPVQDETGIQGLYDFDFAFEPLNVVTSSDSGLASLYTVLEDQLGLKLKAANIAVQTLVVDHVERPDGN